MSILNSLNTAQQGAAKVIEGPLLILAGAGSGKTRTVTYRIAHMIKEKGISPYHILAVTFTNKAAAEMRERVGELIGEDANKVVLSTFHSFGVRMLRMYATQLGYDSNFNIYDNDDQVRLVKKILKSLGAKTDQTPKKIVGLISKLKEDGTSPEEYEKTVPAFLQNYKVIVEVYKRYAEELKKNNSMDFSDLLINTNELLNLPEILERVQDRYRYVMVDEYQDTNNIQYQIIKKIANKYKNICVVGDEDQSIYGFRGADIQNILDFEKDYKEAKVVKLEQNYRSTNVILKAANEVIKENKSSRGKKLWTSKEGGEKIKVYTAPNAIEEAFYVVQKVVEGQKAGKKYSDYTVLYRTNAQSRAFEEALMRFNIPYKVFGGMQFYQRKEIKDIIAYLNVINNPKDSLSLTRIINVPNRKIGDKSVEKLVRFSEEKEITLVEGLKLADNIDKLTKVAREGMKGLGELFEKLIELASIGTVTEVFDQLMRENKYVESLGEDEEGRKENINELKNSIYEMEEQSDHLSLGEYLETTSLLSATDTLDEERDHVKLMTIHNSKGLEFPVVFLTGMEHEIFPGFATDIDEKGLEEERRLCYVAITRAERELHLTHALERTVYGQTSYMRPVSKFLEEIPSELIEGYKKLEEKKELKKAKIENFNPFRKKVEVKSPFKVGDKVVHKKFGQGLVKDIEGEKRIVIKFREGEKKIPLMIAEKFLSKV